MKRILAAIALLSISGALYAEGARDATKAFAKLQARTEAGIAYRDYAAALGDANYEFKAFKDGPEWGKYPEVAHALDYALGRYAEAGMLWQLSMASGPTLYEKSVMQQIVAKYPDAAKSLTAGGATFDTGGMQIARVLPFYWQDAATSVDAARRSLQK